MSGAPHELLARVAAIARRAGHEILEVYASGEPAARLKADASPLTAADLRAHRLIEQSLHELTPEVPVLSEEAAHTRLDRKSTTSELQSRVDLVCRLLLEKKKHKQMRNT